MSVIRRHQDESKARLCQIRRTNGNNQCADCRSPDPKFTCLNKGLFLCINCCGVHTSFNNESESARIKSIEIGDWTEAMLGFMEQHGNEKGSAIWEKNVPVFYRRPKPGDPHVLKEQWIRSKYEHKQFMEGAKEPSYINGSMRGHLKKKRKDDNNWNLRLFVLSESKLSYYIKEQEKPKNVLDVAKINVTFAQEKTDQDNSLQITYVTDGVTRNYFVSSESGREIVDWYMAIRAAKLKVHEENGLKFDPLNMELTRDFTMEGYLEKRGPRGEPWQKRWCTLDGRRFLYFEQPMSPEAKGEFIIGSQTEGFAVQQGEVTGKFQDEDYCFTLTTPDRHFLFKADTENERMMWLNCISDVVAQPMTDEDKTEMKKASDGLKKVKSKSIFRSFRKSSFLDDDI
ncbi:arf-GAP with dual PH domain-containing protein 1-like isoform X1 [Acropora muricata]|uniref:arf-GAP with dual PH domain-containing protein 1-like isoform X1 n=1 Tax=Acropora muricata TaxID=159855 RepID=UPI0034E4B46B